MNATQAQPIARNASADADWIVIIDRHIEALPQTLADVADAYTVGCMEAEQGQPCEPLAHYSRLGDIEQYICGHKDATVAIAAAAELEDDMRDREWIRQGC